MSGQLDIRNVLFGDRIRELRLARHLSIREAARDIGIDKSTLLKLEHGGAVGTKVRSKVCTFFGVVAYDPTERPLAAHHGKHYAVHLPDQARWQMISARLDPHSAIITESLQEDYERMRLGKYGLALSFFKSFQIRMVGTGVSASLNEIFAPLEEPHPAGDYCLILGIRGSLTVSTGDESFVVGEGGAAMFESCGSRRCAPTEDSELPAVAIFVDWPRREITRRGPVTSE